MLSFKRNSLPSSSLPLHIPITKPSSKLKKRRDTDGEVREAGWAKSLFRRKGSVDSDTSSKRRGSTDSDSSFLPSSASTSFFHSNRSSFSSADSQSHPASTSTPSLYITPPSPSPHEVELSDSEPPAEVQWPFSWSSSSSSSLTSSYATSTFSASSSSLSTGADSESPTRDSSLFLSYLLKYSFPPSTTAARLISVTSIRPVSDGQDEATRTKPRLVDYYLDSSLR